jgi:hypothetical protein
LTAGDLAGIATFTDANKGGVAVSVGAADGTRLWASPQATVGFTLDEIWKFARSIVNTDLRIFDEAERSVRQEDPGGTSLSGMNPIHGSYLSEAASRARLEIIEILRQGQAGAWPAAYEGFLTIVISYLLMGARQEHQWDYYKQIAPLMSRVSLGEMIVDDDVLPQWTQFFTPDRVLNAAGIQDGVLYQKGVANQGNIKRSDWITSISKGGDSLAALEKSETGSMSALDDNVRLTAEGKRLYPLELRRLPKEIKPQDWARLAADLYDYSRQWCKAV